MTRKSIEVEPIIGGSTEGTKLLDKKSYRVVISVDGKRNVFEARLTSGQLETLSDPQQYIEEFFKREPLPQTTVIDIPWLSKPFRPHPKLPASTFSPALRAAFSCRSVGVFPSSDKVENQVASSQQTGAFR